MAVFVTWFLLAKRPAIRYNWSCVGAPGSSNGRTADFGSESRGSNPCPGTTCLSPADSRRTVASTIKGIVADRTTEAQKRSIVWSIPTNELANLAKGSSSFAAILRHFGLNNKGGNRRTLKRRLETEGIDYSHINQGRAANRDRRFERSEDFLVAALTENSTTSKWYLKQKLIQQGILLNLCTACGIDPEWNGLPLVLSLDHINGKPDDNRLANLRLLCPNCHSQTHNYTGRKTRKP